MDVIVPALERAQQELAVFLEADKVFWSTQTRDFLHPLLACLPLSSLSLLLQAVQALAVVDAVQAAGDRL